MSDDLNKLNSETKPDVKTVEVPKTELDTNTANKTNSNAPLTLNHTQQVALNDKEVLNHTQQVGLTQKEILNHTKQAEKTNAIVKSKELNNAKKQVFVKTVTENINVLRGILLLDLILAILTTFFFSSRNVAYIGFPIYTILVSIILYSFLKKNKLLANKSGLIWLIPINLIAFSNALFYTNTHSLNIFVVHIFFAIMLIKVTNVKFASVYDFGLFRRVLSNFVPNFTFTGVALDKAVINRDTSFVKKSKSNILSILLGFIVALPVLFIVLILLSNADQNFGNMVENLFQLRFRFENVIVRILYFLGAFVIFMFYSIKIFYTKDFLPKETKRFKINSVSASTFLILLNIVYILFLYLQAQYIFTDGLLALPSDFTYSEYARDGFFPTFTVTIINLCLITFIIHFTSIDFSNKVFKLNFIVMFTSNILLIFNALNRMYLYIATYGYTTLRTLPTLALFLVLVLMILLGLYLVKKINFYKYALLSFVVFYVVQAYTCNDIVSTSLNFNKFNVTFDDLTLNVNDEFVIITSDGHVLDFVENIDTYWYYSTLKMSYVNKIPMRHYADTPMRNYYGWTYYSGSSYEDNYMEVHENVPFYSKTFLQLSLEKLWY